MGVIMDAGSGARVPGWEIILADRIAAARHAPFVWGAHDCATWAADMRAALTGTASAADAWRGRYTTPIGAGRVMRRLGWDDMTSAATAILGAPIGPYHARRGDIVLHEGALGICDGAGALFVGPAGLVRVTLARCDLGWRV